MEFEHSKKGSKWKKHKYLEIRNGKYIYSKNQAGTKRGYRYKWMDKYRQEAEQFHAKVFSNGVNMYTRNDGQTVITYPGHGVWTVAKGTNLKDLNTLMENFAKSYSMKGTEDGNPKQAQNVEKFMNALHEKITGEKAAPTTNVVANNVNAKTSNDIKQKTDNQVQNDSVQQQTQPEQAQQQTQPEQAQQQTQPEQAQQQTQPEQQIQTATDNVAAQQERQKQNVSEAEATSSKNRLNKIGNRRNKLYSEAQELSKKLAENPNDKDVIEDINDLYNEIDNYNDEISDHLEKLQDFGMTNDEIQKYANSVGIALDSNLKPYYLNLKNLEKKNSMSNIMHKLTNPIYSQYFGNECSKSFAHIGRSKRDGAKVGSGRYPLGSGENPRSGRNKKYRRSDYDDGYSRGRNNYNNYGGGRSGSSAQNQPVFQFQPQYQLPQQPKVNRQDVVEISRKDFDDIMEHIRRKDSEVNRMNLENVRLEADNKYKNDVRKAKTMRNIAIVGLTGLAIYTAVKGNNTIVPKDGNLLKEVSDNVKKVADIKEHATADKKKIEETKEKIKETKETFKEGLINSAKSGSTAGIKDSVRTIAKGSTTIGVKNIVDEIAGKKVSDAIYTASNTKNADTFWKGVDKEIVKKSTPYNNASGNYANYLRSVRYTNGDSSLAPEYGSKEERSYYSHWSPELNTNYYEKLYGGSKGKWV